MGASIGAINWDSDLNINIYLLLTVFRIFTFLILFVSHFIAFFRGKISNISHFAIAIANFYPLTSKVFRVGNLKMAMHVKSLTEFVLDIFLCLAQGNFSPHCSSEKIKKKLLNTNI